MAIAAGPRLAGWQHALAVGAICLATAARFYPAVISVAPLGDELAQEAAFQNEAAGRSPYLEGSYVYPPSLLRLGSVLRGLPRSPFIPLRCLSLLGLAVVLWSATGWLGWRPWKRLAAAVLYAALAPGVRQGIEFGNLSFAVAGMIVLALLVWERSPIGSGLLLGASLLVKPLAPAALVALLCHRPAAPGHRHRWAAAVAIATAGLLLLSDPEFGAFLSHGSHAWVLGRTVSVHRFLALSQIPEGASVLTLLLLAAVAVVARARVSDREQLLAVALAGCVMVTPVVWNHTLVLTLPLQAMAIAIAADRFRAATPPERRRRGWEATGIALAVAALTFAEGATGIDNLGIALQVAATLPPALAPAVLAAYVLRFHTPFA
ncbi:MAG: glycosyltransferase 87 family protein, partial [Thermoanaerobaculia bacterium]